MILNSLKHGLVSGAGSLTVTLARIESSPDRALLSVADTGPGLPEDFEPEKPRSMGFRLINLLVRQLKGVMTIADGPGTRIEVEFDVTRE